MPRGPGAAGAGFVIRHGRVDGSLIGISRWDCGKRNETEQWSLSCLRPHRHRRRPRRLCLRHPRGAARHEGRRGRKARHPRRHLPQYRLHPVEGAAAMRPSFTRKPGTNSREMGIKVGKPELDLAAMLEHKEKGVDGNVKGVEFCSRRTRSSRFIGAGRIAAPGKVEVKADDGKTQLLETKNIVIATGSDVAPLPGVDDRREAHRVLDRRARARQGAAEASGRRRRHHRARTRLGVAPARRRGHGGRIPRPHLPGIDGEVAKQFQRMLQKQGLAFKLVVEGHRRSTRRARR